MKYILILVFLFCSVGIFSQQLEQNDIDIFIKGYKQIDRTVKEISNTSEWTEYNDLGVNCLHYISGIFEENITGDYIEELKEACAEFINYGVPDRLENTFVTIGWANGGQKKLATLTIGMFFFIVKERMEDNLNQTALEQAYQKILAVLNRQDFDIINNRFEDLKKLE
jgi:hypothetical protein